MRAAGEKSISRQQLMDVLKYKGTDDFVDLVEGDITETVPKYIKKHPELRISLLNLDTEELVITLVKILEMVI